MSEPYTPEIGQMCFDNPWGNYDADEIGSACVRHALGEIGRVFWNVNQREWDEHEDPKIPGLVFHPYFWGECECGYEQREWEWSEANKHSAGCYQTDYQKLTQDTRDAEAKRLCKKHGIPWNRGFGSAVHCTCDHNAKWREWRAANDHSPTCPTVLPNLALENDDIQVRWYKHPGRGLSVNREMDGEAWRFWLNRICRTIRAADVAL